MENSYRDGNTRTHYLSPEKPVCRSGSKLDQDMEKWTSSKLGKEYNKAVYCHCLFHFYAEYIIQMLAWVNHKWEYRLLGEISTTSDMQMTTLMAEHEEELKIFLIIVKEENENAGLKHNVKKKKKKSKISMSSPTTW